MLRATRVDIIILIRGVCGEFGWVRFLVVLFPIKKTIPTREKLFTVGKSGPTFLGLGWPWVGEFAGFIVTFTRVPTQHNLVLVYRKHPISVALVLYVVSKVSVLWFDNDNTIISYRNCFGNSITITVHDNSITTQ